MVHVTLIACYHSASSFQSPAYRLPWNIGYPPFGPCHRLSRVKHVKNLGLSLQPPLWGPSAFSPPAVTIMGFQACGCCPLLTVTNLALPTGSCQQGFSKFFVLCCRKQAQFLMWKGNKIFKNFSRFRHGILQGYVAQGITAQSVLELCAFLEQVGTRESWRTHTHACTHMHPHARILDSRNLTRDRGAMGADSAKAANHPTKLRQRVLAR